MYAHALGYKYYQTDVTVPSLHLSPSLPVERNALAILASRCTHNTRPSSLRTRQRRDAIYLLIQFTATCLHAELRLRTLEQLHECDGKRSASRSRHQYRFEIVAPKSTFWQCTRPRSLSASSQQPLTCDAGGHTTSRGHAKSHSITGRWPVFTSIKTKFLCTR